MLIAIKGIALAIDPAVHLYLGDSAAYLAGGLSDAQLPRDRSFVYSLLIRALVAPSASLPVLVLWQTLAGIGIALLLRTFLVRHLGVSRRLGAIGACALAIEPAQLFYERMVMAETFGLLAFAACVVAAGEYLRSGRRAWLPIISVLGLAAAALRLNYLPVILFISLVPPLLRALDGARRPSARVLLVDTMVAACCVAVVHTTYRHAVASIFHVPPAYLARAGFMQMALVAPLIQPEHFARVGLPADFGERLAYALDDPDARASHAWQPGGLADAIAAQPLDFERVARRLSRMAVLADPLGLARLGVHTIGNYFRPRKARWALEDDLGLREYPDALVRSLREDWGYTAVDPANRMTPIGRYFKWSASWLVACFCLIVPLAGVHVLMSWHSRTRPLAMLCALASVGLVVAHVLFTHIALYRYLQPLPFVLMVSALASYSNVAGNRSRAAPGSAGPALR